MKKIMSHILAWKTGACLSFTAAVIIYSVIAWACGQRAVELRILLSLLLICAVGSAIQLLCFTDHIYPEDALHPTDTTVFGAVLSPAVCHGVAVSLVPHGVCRCLAGVWRKLRGDIRGCNHRI